MGRIDMNVGIAIGENHRFELREALLVYTENRNATFITRHAVTLRTDGPPTLGPAQPLTVAFVESLVRSLGGETNAEVLPENVLTRTERMICWWTPVQRRQMFYENSEGKAAALNGRTFPQPPLVWRVADGELKVRALVENKRPTASTQFAVAPFWNLSESGQVCTGSMRRPAGASVSTIVEWEKGFYESAFTHANIGRITRHTGGFEGLWSSLRDKWATFPAESLIVLPQTLAQFVLNERY
jgi:PRTRC genetic system protein B